MVWHERRRAQVLPLLLVDVYLLLQRPRTLADLRAKSEEEVDDDDSLVERGEDGSRTVSLPFATEGGGVLACDQ